MTELFLLEHKKLWRRTSTKISVLLCFIYVVIFGSILSFQWFSFGSSDDYTSAFGNNFDGYGMIRDRQEYSLEFGGKLTEGSLQQLVRDYQKMEKLTGFYERRQETIGDFLETIGQVGTEKEYLLQMDSEVKEPFRYEWVEGWSQLLSSGVADIGVVMALFLAITLSSLFAGEWYNNTSSLVLTTRNGWKKIAYAKICTGLSFTVELFAILMVGNVVSKIFFMGTAGWDMPVQTIKLIAIAPMNMLQAEIYEYTFTFLGAVGFAGVVMFISAKTRSNVLALLFSLAVVYGPMMIVEYVWSPYLLITVPVLIGILCLLLAVKGWSRRLRA